MHYPDIMVDLETTGVNPDENAIIQIAAVRFDLITGSVDAEDMFDQCLMIPTKRFWDEGTREWWSKKGEVYAGIAARMNDPREVLQNFSNWAGREKPRFWSKPSHFDFMFVSSYMKQFNVYMPFDFREAQDMRSFLRGYHFPKPMPDIHVDFVGPKHNAIFDVLNQIATVLEHVKQ